MIQVKLVASSNPPITAVLREKLAHHSIRMKANRPSTPDAHGTIRHPTGPSPNSAIAPANSDLPSSGCSILAGWTRSARVRAAGM